MEPSTLPPTGKITIEWSLGHEPNDFDTYAWRVTCYPQLPDEAVAGILAEVLKAY